MNPAAESDQLIVQTHRLSLDEPTRPSITSASSSGTSRTANAPSISSAPGISSDEPTVLGRDGGVHPDVNAHGRGHGSGYGYENDDGDCAFDGDGVAADRAAGARPGVRREDGRRERERRDREPAYVDLDLELSMELDGEADVDVDVGGEECEVGEEEEVDEVFYSRPCLTGEGLGLEDLPTEILFHVLEFLDVCDLLSTSRTCHTLRSVSLTPLLHIYRLRRTRSILPPLLWSRPSLADLISKSIFLTNTSVVSRRLGRSLVSIRLARRLAARPSAEALVERAVLPKECVPGMAPVTVAPGIIQRRKVIERERIKDGLRRWIEGKWRGEVREREECQRRWEESRGVGRVWRLRKFWERVGRGDIAVR